MKLESSIRLSIVSSTVLAVLCGLTQTGLCQTTKEAPTLVVSGRVVNIFRSASSSDEFLVQILVQKSEAIKLERSEKSTRFPAPGEYLYAHVGNSGRDAVPLPRPDTNLRATLNSGNHQQWVGRGSWFQPIGSGDSVADNSSGDFGVSTEPVSLQFRRALKVTEVKANSPAAKVGLEVGDVLVSADGLDIETPDQLAEQVRKSSGTLKLTVRDIRSDKNIPVEVDLSGRKTVMRNAGGSLNRKLGLKSELAFFKGNAVLKITEVAAGSPAQQAGIKLGMLILTANGNSVSKPESLTSAATESNGLLTVKLVDPKTRSESTVRINLR